MVDVLLGDFGKSSHHIPLSWELEFLAYGIYRLMRREHEDHYGLIADAVAPA